MHTAPCPGPGLWRQPFLCLPSSGTAGLTERGRRQSHRGGRWRQPGGAAPGELAAGGRRRGGGGGGAAGPAQGERIPTRLVLPCCLFIVLAAGRTGRHWGCAISSLCATCPRRPQPGARCSPGVVGLGSHHNPHTGWLACHLATPDPPAYPSLVGGSFAAAQGGRGAPGG